MPLQARDCRPDPGTVKGEPAIAYLLDGDFDVLGWGIYDTTRQAFLCKGHKWGTASAFEIRVAALRLAQGELHSEQQVTPGDITVLSVGFCPHHH